MTRKLARDVRVGDRALLAGRYREVQAAGIRRTTVTGGLAGEVDRIVERILVAGNRRHYLSPNTIVRTRTEENTP
jgi:hypothetical protein